MHSDEFIMQSVARGNVAQLAELYRRYRDPLYGFLLRRANEPAVAEDLLQATFERVIKYRASYKGPTFRSWLYAIARNVMHDRQRKEGRMPRKNGVDLGTLPLATPSVECAWTDRDTRDQSLAALAALPANYREVVDLAWKRGLKYAEIANVLGITEANVKVRMYRATKQLKVNYAKLNEL
ncbi:MAG: sigma-70 family RNA polymerase sigma factor [Bacteroidota bacterium]